MSSKFVFVAASNYISVSSPIYLRIEMYACDLVMFNMLILILKLLNLKKMRAEFKKSCHK